MHFRAAFFLSVCTIVLVFSTHSCGEKQYLATGTPYNVTYDSRSLLLNGERGLFLTGSIHYPRSTPSMWDDIMKKTKEGGINAVETYTFWNLHEPMDGVFDWESLALLKEFLTVVQRHELYAILRFGPYICGEWTYGGLPLWLRNEPGMIFRDDNEPFKAEMKEWMTFIVDFIRPFLASQGGPIVLVQVENEYKYLESDYGEPGKKYAEWAIEMAHDLNVGIPWIMCEQDDIPQAINTCNGFYCDNWISDHVKTFPNQPSFFTENWPGWFQHYGEPFPTRPAEDIAFSVARWFARGGTLNNYYMWHGGTNFGRTVGGPFITTSYDYDVALDEYGLLAQPKYDHLKSLHTVLMEHSSNFLSTDVIPSPVPLGDNQDAMVYGSLAILSNIDATKDAIVTYNETTFSLPKWSCTFVENGEILYVTSKINAPANEPTFDAIFSVSEKISQYWTETIGIWNASRSIITDAPAELLSLTQERTDYVWYCSSFDVPDSSVDMTLSLLDTHDYVHVYVDEELIRSYEGGPLIEIPLGKLDKGTHSIEIMCMEMGLVNFGEHLEKLQLGILGGMLVNGKPMQSRWKQIVGTEGEMRHAYDPSHSVNVPWRKGMKKDVPMTWHQIALPGLAFFEGKGPLAVRMTGMDKGILWINGHSLGRYWMITGIGDCSACDYAGPYDPSMCRVNCEKPSQELYHLPMDWLKEVDNVLTIFEEIGGDPSQIVIGTRSRALVKKKRN
eukprot:TRINITY_DN1663_c0_g1_i1.p1 TRINITY_DN1663_c0_g1~~TRINITY_DN1663_c0_g1_i1.p1  ORF type:complete len:750 (-),score=172.43 TRINITY_DN1663_c0_g1_i1:67-2250(-)